MGGGWSRGLTLLRKPGILPPPPLSSSMPAAEGSAIECGLWLWPSTLELAFGCQIGDIWIYSLIVMCLRYISLVLELKTPSSTYKPSDKSGNHKGTSKLKFIRVSDLCIVPKSFHCTWQTGLSATTRSTMCICLGGVGFHFPIVRTRRGLQTSTQWVTFSPPTPISWKLTGFLGPQDPGLYLNTT